MESSGNLDVPYPRSRRGVDSRSPKPGTASVFPIRYTYTMYTYHSDEHTLQCIMYDYTICVQEVYT